METTVLGIQTRVCEVKLIEDPCAKAAPPGYELPCTQRTQHLTELEPNGDDARLYLVQVGRVPSQKTVQKMSYLAKPLIYKHHTRVTKKTKPLFVYTFFYRCHCYLHVLFIRLSIPKPFVSVCTVVIPYRTHCA